MTAKTEREKAQKLIADNRKAFHDYHVLDTWEAGVALLGTEVKAIREGRVNLRDSFARLEKGEVWLHERAHQPLQPQRLRPSRRASAAEVAVAPARDPEADRQGAGKGLTLVPLQMYFKGGRVKVALALVKGKQAHDKRETIRRREVDRETRAAVKERSR